VGFQGLFGLSSFLALDFSSREGRMNNFEKKKNSYPKHKLLFRCTIADKRNGIPLRFAHFKIDAIF